MEDTSTRLKRLMGERNLRQIDIIRMAEPFCREYNLKLTKSDMSQFVSGKVEPGQWKLTILGKALGVSEAWLMGYDVPMERETPAPSEPTERDKIAALFMALSSENQQKMMEYGRLLLMAQGTEKESQVEK